MKSHRRREHRVWARRRVKSLIAPGRYHSSEAMVRGRISSFIAGAVPLRSICVSRFAVIRIWSRVAGLKRRPVNGQQSGGASSR